MSDVDRQRTGAVEAAASHLRVVKGSATDSRVASFGPADEALTRLAETGVAVMIRGERGTGKEVAARAIHGRSARHGGTFIKVNCTAPAPLLEAELFGCERGALAGAAQHRPGKLEFANGGALFLDDVLDLPAALQQRLLQVLKEGGFTRLGAREAVRVRVRVLASTSADPERAVAAGRFHEELFFRLNVVSLTLPPLRQRRSEIPELARFFLRQHASHFNRPDVGLSRDTLRLLTSYPWPGNVHELTRRMHGVVVDGTEEGLIRDLAVWRERHIEPALLAAPDATSAPAVSLKEIGRQAADAAERALIYRTLQLTRWNRREAADILRVSYKALLYKIKKAELAGAS